MHNLDTNPEESQFWMELKEALHLGGVFKDENMNYFIAPYVWGDFPESLDPWLYGVCLDKNISVYKEPDKNSEIIYNLQYNIVKIIDYNCIVATSDDSTLSWNKIQLPSGERGYVQVKHIRSPTDYLVVIEKKDGMWKITCFSEVIM